MASLVLVFLCTSCLLFDQASSRAVNITSSWTLPQEGFPHFFRYFKEPATWEDARAICGSHQAQLITVENDERRDAARAYLKELDVLENVWCGLKRTTIQAPFVWTGGGLGPVVGDAFWQEPHPLEPEQLCVAINPLYDFRWQTFPCSGPQLNSFLCQLEVPEWATGENGCLVNSLPSLTVTYLPELGVIELLSDCGLSGTKRIACKGGEKKDDLMKRLSCERDEENQSSTSSQHLESSTIGSISKILRWASSTPSDAVNSITSHITYSSGTRHKRESGGTSTSTEKSIQQEGTEEESIISESHPEEIRIPAPEPLSPLDTTTITAEFVKEDQIEETTISVIGNEEETKTEQAAEGSHRLSVKSWMQSINEKFAASAEETTTEIVTTVASTTVKETKTSISPEPVEIEKVTNSPITPEQVKDILTTAEEPRQTKKTAEIPPTAESPKVLPTTAPVSEDRGSNMPHPPLMQLRGHQIKVTTSVKTTVPTETTTQLLEIMPENALVITVEDSELNETENELPQESKIAQLPEREALVSEKFQDSAKHKVFAKSRKNAFQTEEKRTIPTIAAPQTKAATTKKIVTSTESPEDPNRNIPVIVIEELDEVEVIDNDSTEAPKIEEKTEVVTEITDKSETISDIKTPEIPIQTSETVPENSRPVFDKSNIASDIENTEEKVNNSDNVKKLDVILLEESLTHEPKDTVTDTPTQMEKVQPTKESVVEEQATAMPESATEVGQEATHDTTSKVRNEQPDVEEQTKNAELQESAEKISEDLSTAEPLKGPSPVPVAQEPEDVIILEQETKPNQESQKSANLDQVATSTSQVLQPSTIESITEEVHPVQRLETTGSVSAVDPRTPKLETSAQEEFTRGSSTRINERTTAFSTEFDLKITKSASDLTTSPVSTSTDENAPETAISEESSEEAENPRKNPRSRLFQHSNPLSFYPYFLTKVLG